MIWKRSEKKDLDFPLSCSYTKDTSSNHIYREDVLLGQAVRVILKNKLFLKKNEFAFEDSKSLNTNSWRKSQGNSLK